MLLWGSLCHHVKREASRLHHIYALEVARHLLPRFPDGVFVTELGPLSSPELVPATVASALGLTHIVGTVSREGVAGAVGTRKLLLVIDNCEHVIEAAAGMAEALLRASQGVSLLATSREPLRVPGEHVYRVPSLDVPAEDAQDMEDVFRYGAVRLFVSRAHAAEPRYVAEGPVLAATAAICRRLDGIPSAPAWSWAALMHRAFAIDVLACPDCGGRLRLIGTIHDPTVIRKILAHLGRSPSGQSPGPSPPDAVAAAP